jgi:FtsH-binding integral membrane protein
VNELPNTPEIPEPLDISKVRDLPGIPKVPDVPVGPRHRQTSIARMFVLTALVAVLAAVAPRLYKQGFWGMGEILSVVLVGTVIAGAAIGLLQGGMERMFQGVIVALFIFVAAAFLIFVGAVLVGF